MSQPSSYLKLTRMERLYVDGRLAGLTQIASAAAAGAAHPRVDGHSMEKKDHVQKALIARIEKVAEEVDFSRKEAHTMYLDAYENAETATEQIAAVNAMVKLHGLEKAKEVVIQHNHNHTGQIEHMPTAELMKLAGMEEQLVLEGEFTEVEEKPLLEPPVITEDNIERREELSEMRDDY
jgi:hypothetical protein